MGSELILRCSSLGYKVGNFVDDSLGGGIQDVGIGVVGAGAAIEVSTWFTGFGERAGL
jgi:hypothetical protein